MLALGTSILALVSIPFLRIVPLGTPYFPVGGHPSRERLRSRGSHRTTGSSDFQYIEIEEESDEPGTQSTAFQPPFPAHVRSQSQISNPPRPSGHNTDLGETSSLVSKAVSRQSRDFLANNMPDVGPDSPHPDVRGLAMLPKTEFWQLFMTMALLSGIGLMTIKYVPLWL